MRYLVCLIGLLGALAVPQVAFAGSHAQPSGMYDGPAAIIVC